MHYSFNLIYEGMHMYVGSQWFTLPRHVVQWLLQDPLPKHYQSYAQFVVIADENYFATLISNSPYCNDILRKKNLFLIFDKWENELSGVGERDPRKCLSPDPDHCGRSPSTLTSKLKNLLDVSRATFARKFDPLDSESLQLLDEIDRWRQEPINDKTRDEGHHMMIRSSAYMYRKGDQRVDKSIENHPTQIGCKRTEIEGINLVKPNLEIETRGCSVSEIQESDFDFCWEMGAIGQPLTLNVCDASKSSQWFTLGRAMFKQMRWSPSIFFA